MMHGQNNIILCDVANMDVYQVWLKSDKS